MTKLSNSPPLGNYRPSGHEFLRRAQLQAERFYRLRADGWLYAGRTRIRHRSRGVLHDRQPRAERAEAIARMVAHDLGRVDLRTLRIVDHRLGVGISLRRKARDVGITIDEAKGAQHDLGACGYVGSHQKRAPDKDGRYPIATRWFTAKFFRQIGMWKALIAVRRLLGLAPPKEPKAIGAVARTIDHLVSSLAPSPWPSRV